MECGCVSRLRDGRECRVWVRLPFAGREGVSSVGVSPVCGTGGSVECGCVSRLRDGRECAVWVCLPFAGLEGVSNVGAFVFRGTRGLKNTLTLSVTLFATRFREKLGEKCENLQKSV